MQLSLLPMLKTKEDETAGLMEAKERELEE